MGLTKEVVVAMTRDASPVGKTRGQSWGFGEWFLGIFGGIATFLGLFILLADEDQSVGFGGDWAWRVGDIDTVWAYVLLVTGVVLLSGALAGLAGCIEVAGRAGYVTLDMSPGYGYTGIVIAMLAQLNPIAVVAAAIFVAGILVGADSMSRAIAVPTYIADVIVASSLIAMLVATMLARYRILWR